MLDEGFREFYFKMMTENCANTENKENSVIERVQEKGLSQSSRKPKSNIETWTSLSTKRLIQITGEMDEVFQHPQSKKIKLCGKVSTKLEKEGFNFSPVSVT